MNMRMQANRAFDAGFAAALAGQPCRPPSGAMHSPWERGYECAERPQAGEKVRAKRRALRDWQAAQDSWAKVRRAAS